MSDDERGPLDDLPAPDLWPRIERGLRQRERVPSGGRARRPGDSVPQRLLAAIVALVVFAGGIGFAWVALVGHAGPGEPAGPGSHPSASPRLPAAAPVTVSADFKRLPARCSATLVTPVVRPGQVPVVRYTLTDLGGRPIRYGNYLDFPSITDRSGATVYTWEEQYGGMPSLPAPALVKTLGAGQSVTRSDVGQEPVIAWPGPLDLHVTCPFVLGTESHHSIDMISSPRLPALPLRVFAPGRAPAAGVAIARAEAATGGLFDACRPLVAGRSVTGQIRPPTVARPPKVIPASLPARCRATVEVHGGFDVVTLAFASPPSAPLAGVGAPMGSTVLLPHLPSVEVFRWAFVVTRRTVTSGLAASAGRSPMPTVGFTFERGRWGTGDLSCTGGGSYFGGGPSISFPVPRNPC